MAEFYSVGMLYYPWHNQRLPYQDAPDRTKRYYIPSSLPPSSHLYTRSANSSVGWPLPQSALLNQLPGFSLTPGFSRESHSGFLQKIKKLQYPALDNINELLDALHSALADPNQHRKATPLKIEALTALLVANHLPPLNDPASRDLLTEIIKLMRIRLASKKNLWNYSLNVLDHWCQLTLMYVETKLSKSEYQAAEAYFEPILQELALAAAPVAEQFRQGDYSSLLETLALSAASPTLLTEILIAVPTLTGAFQPSARLGPPLYVFKALMQRPDQQDQLVHWQKSLTEVLLAVAPNQDPSVVNNPVETLKALELAGLPLPGPVIQRLVAWCQKRSNRLHYEALASLPSFVRTPEGSKFLLRSLSKEVLLSLLKHAPLPETRIKALQTLIKRSTYLKPEEVWAAFAENPVGITKGEYAALISHPQKEFRLEVLKLLGTLSPTKAPTL